MAVIKNFRFDGSLREISCLASDTKPTSGIPQGSILHEVDTRIDYILQGTTWYPISGWSYSGEKGVTTSVIKNSAGIFHSMLIKTDGTNNVTVQIFDHASNATNPVTPPLVIPGGDRMGGSGPIDAICSNGIVLVLSGTGGIATVFYR